MQFRLTRKQIINAFLLVALGIGSLSIQPAAAQVSRSAFRETAEELGLSRSQMREVGGIMRSLNSEVEDILTTEQFELIKAAREEQNQDPQALQEDLNLTDSQAEQLALARRETVVELRQVLTPTQLQGIMDMAGFTQF